MTPYRDGNRFQFIRHPGLQDMTVLNAAMDDFSYRRHAHEEFAFGVTLSGRQDFFAAGAFHRSPAGSVIIFNPEEVHDGHSGGDEHLHYRMLYIHPRRLAPVLASLGVRSPEHFRLKQTLRQNAVMYRQLLQLSATGSMATSLADPETRLFEFAESLVRENGLSSEENTTGKRPSPEMVRARDCLLSQPDSCVPLDQLSRETGLSKYHLIRRFRDAWGLTPHQYWVNWRINRVCQALQQGIAPVDAACDYGFSDLSHLNRCFKPVYGMTPAAYRKLFHRH